ncbi:acyltransferase [Wenyingzhuangia fucanilytica]|uniref:Acyltransferase n=2 Tax=Wenyingzhuangia fucanilytica TaxID=1790137 RepID=A0A1B1Y4A5_9FLAO|nr:acyltransferase [Wenyingzhuangia fucanilytica]
MLFNSLDFAVFLPIIFILYWFVLNKSLKHQNILLVLSSYLFYGWWDWRFLFLIIGSTLVDYFIGLQIAKNKNRRKQKLLLYISLTTNLGLLSIFKYYNFFLENFIMAFSFFGTSIKANSLNIILPVGISFYTFQTLSYTIDVYRKTLKPTKNFIAFSAFVSFFPQLVAGPIERASNLLPQILHHRIFNKKQFIEGIRLMIFGFFQKIVIADTLAPVVNQIFNNYTYQSGGTLILGAIYFSIQIYGDFSGYSKIARGLAKLLGFELMMNFNFPYFSRSIGQFWRRWHISLNTWFRDYLYIPLGGSRTSKMKTIRNISIIFLASGLWHGANWTYIAWAIIHIGWFIVSFLLGNNRKHLEDRITEKNFLSKGIALLQIIRTFTIVTIAWVFFRAENITTGFHYLLSMNFNFDKSIEMLSIVILAITMDVLYLKFESKNFIYSIMLGAIIAASIMTTKAEFIYFQF